MTKPTTEEKDPGIQILVRMAATLVVWAVTLVAAIKILDREPQSVALRAGALALAIGGFLPWVWIASRAIVAQDEFTRRVHFIALSWAFAATGVFVISADLLVRAHFIDYLPIMNIWVFMVAAWWLAIMLTARYYL